jgi:hypothetical protein
MARTKSGLARRRTQIRHRHKRKEKRKKLARKMGITVDELLEMMARGDVKVI